MMRRQRLVYLERDHIKVMAGDPAHDRPAVLPPDWSGWQVEQVCVLERRTYLVLGRDEPPQRERYTGPQQRLYLLDKYKAHRLIPGESTSIFPYDEAGELPANGWRIDRIWPAGARHAYALLSEGPIAAPVMTGCMEVARESLPAGLPPGPGRLTWFWTGESEPAPARAPAKRAKRKEGR